MESKGRSVLDTPLSRSMTVAAGERSDEAIHSFFTRRVELLRPRSLSSGAHSRDPLASRNDEWGNRFSDNGDVTIGALRFS